MSIDQFEIDGHPNCYNKLVPYIRESFSASGASAEVGLRRAGTTALILQEQVNSKVRIPHICIDPYGQIPYSVNERIVSTDYSNEMRNDTLAKLYTYASDHNLDVIFFNMEDREFYERFRDYVPFYKQAISKIVEYSFVHIDGQHSYEAVKPSADFFLPRLSKGAIIAFDNSDTYDHGRVEEDTNMLGVLEKLEVIPECGRAIYRKL